MLKLSIKPLAISALFAMSLTSAATLAVAQENHGIVLQESAAEARVTAISSTWRSPRRL